MFHIQTDDLLDVACPLLDIFAGKAEHEVDTDIVDANVDAHLMQFNVNDNLTLRPDLNQNEIDYRYNYGVALTFNF